MMKARRLFPSILLAVMLTGSGAQALTIQAGFIANNPQVFPFGGLITPNQISNPESIDLSTFPDLFYVQVTPDRPDEWDVPVYLHMRLVSDAVPNIPIIDYYSSRSQPFTVRDWMEDPAGSGGYYTNSQIGIIAESSDWLRTDDRTSYIDVEDFLSELVSGTSLTSSVYTIDLEIRHAGTDALLAEYSTSIYIFSQSSPSLIMPVDGTQIATTPITFSWTFLGGATSPGDWNLIIVESDELQSDYDSVIENATADQIVYDGPPTSSSSHTFTGGGGGEADLRPGFYYYWQVSVDVQTMYPDESLTSTSNIYSFYYTEETGQGGGIGGGDADQILALLSAYLEASVIDQYQQQLQGYDLDNIMINGQPATIQDLFVQLQSPGFSLIAIELQ
ncbi:hypothetical protein GF324_04080 [bacterium]|nr:hypothetical protein [bacterium]